MKKRLEDVTLGDLVRICNKNEYCRNCPLCAYCPSRRYDTPACMENELLDEVEL